MKIEPLFNKRNPINANAQKLRKALRELRITEKNKKYIKSQLNKMRKSVEDGQP